MDKWGCEINVKYGEKENHVDQESHDEERHHLHLVCGQTCGMILRGERCIIYLTMLSEYRHYGYLILQ